MWSITALINIDQLKTAINSLICPMTKSATHCLTELFLIYQNKHWTNKRQDDCSIEPLSHRIILKIVGFQIHKMKYTFVQNGHGWKKMLFCVKTVVIFFNLLSFAQKPQWLLSQHDSGLKSDSWESVNFNEKLDLLVAS